MNIIPLHFPTGLSNLTQVDAAIVKISSLKKGRYKIKVSIQPVAGHTLLLTFATEDVIHFDSKLMRNMGFTNEDKVLIKILRQEKRYGAKKLLREFVYIIHAYSRCRYLITRLIEEWRLFDQQIIEQAMK